MITAIEALARLRDGNRRFVANQTTALALSDHARRAALVAGQEPFAIVLGCSDSRVPAELVFDQGFGDLFVIRVAGNIVAPSQVGSVEFAAARFGTRLIVVMGHSSAAPSSPRWRNCWAMPTISRETCAPSSTGCGRRWKPCFRAGVKRTPRLW